MQINQLLGHGSGKMLRQNADGTFNFDSAGVKASLEADEAVFNIIRRSF